jgi:acyl carrier protein
VARVQALGFRIVSGQTPVVPLLVGDEGLSDRMAAALKQAGFYVDAVKFPAVGLRQSRLRFIMNAKHTRDELDQLLDVLGTLARDYVDPGPARRPAAVAAPVATPSPAAGTALSALQVEALAELVRVARDELGVTTPVEPGQSLRADLNLDSMGLMIVAGAMEDRFGVSFEGSDGSGIETVADLLSFVERHAPPKANA